MLCSMCMCLLHEWLIFVRDLWIFRRISHKEQFLNMNHLQSLQRILQTRDLLGVGGEVLWYKKISELLMLVEYLDTWLNETRLLTRERLLYQVELLYLNMVDLVCTISNVCISVTVNHVCTFNQSFKDYKRNSGYVNWSAFDSLGTYL